ncbi:hypothetical protein [Micromonospora sp. NPDC000668]|uniref:hypothetical protein n=1 Tax=Micromonospora sp. NPDC000668 TaxID=3364219 RepID=UPI0036C33E92
MTDLKEYLAKRFVPKQYGDAELTELTCRVQIGTPMEHILGELKVVEYVFPEDHVKRGDVTKPGAGSRRTPDRTYIPASLEDKADDVRAVYEFYETLCAEEFNRIPDVFRPAWDEKGGLTYYRSQRPLLFAGGVSDVPEFLRKQIKPNVTFLDGVQVHGGAKKELIDALDGARKWLEGQPGGQWLKRLAVESIPERGRGKRRAIGGWDPRSIIGSAGRPTSMGPHHVGLAVDINASTNPHLKGDAAKTIDAVVDHLASKGKFSGDHRLSKPFIDFTLIDRNPDQAVERAIEMWLKLVSISGAFQGFLKECFDKKKNKQPLDPDMQKLFDRCLKTFGGQQKLERLAAQGVYDLNLVLVVALVKNGMRYGGEFGESKDQHHLQVRNWPFKPPPCVEQWNKKKASGVPGGKRK